MTKRGNERIQIVSLLTSSCGDRIGDALASNSRYEVETVGLPSGITGMQLLREGPQGHGLNVDQADLLLVPVTEDDMQHYTTHCGRAGASSGMLKRWNRTNQAVIGITSRSLTDVQEAEVVLAFDGLLSEDIPENRIHSELDLALARARRRQFWHNRYQKVRQLCDLLNRRRRELRKKVDLLCVDLVDSNIQLSGTLRELQQVYDFQSGLIGEFDRHYLLSKSLRMLKDCLTETNAAFYLCQSDSFEAHVSGAWGNDETDPSEIESFLYQAVVGPVCHRRMAYRPEPGEATPDVKATFGAHLMTLSVMGLPLMIDRELVGVVVFYRQGQQRFNSAEKEKVSPYLKPLGKAVLGLQDLENLIGPVHS